MSFEAIRIATEKIVANTNEQLRREGRIRRDPNLLHTDKEIAIAEARLEHKAVEEELQKELHDARRVNEAERQLGAKKRAKGRRYTL